MDLAPFAAALAARCRSVVLLGATAPVLEGLLRARGFTGIAIASGIEEAVDLGLAAAGAGGVLLLSPGHASYGMFVNYEERGDRFREAVRRRGAGG